MGIYIIKSYDNIGLYIIKTRGVRITVITLDLHSSNKDSISLHSINKK
jgi:hypothetical protein